MAALRRPLSARLDRVPGLERPPAAASRWRRDEPRFAGREQQLQRLRDVPATAIAAEHVADLGARHAARRSPAQRGQDGVSGLVAEQIAEDVSRGCLAVRPHGEPGLNVNVIDRVGTVEQRVDQRQP